MKFTYRFALLFGLLISCAAILLGCGGGGSSGGTTGGQATITGIVLNVETGAATNPQSSVQVGSAHVLSSATDGSFSLAVPAGTTTVTVDTMSAFGVFTFAIPAVTGTQDVGDLWVGPSKVTVAGKVIDAATNAPVSGATVSFAGVNGVTAADGTFSLPGVAYPTSNFASFFGIVGNVRSPNYFANTFSTQPNMAVNGVVTVSDILLTPLSSNTPPPAPYNIWGKITPTAIAGGTTVTLLQNGTAVRETQADNTGAYYFWVPAGTYTITYVNGSHTAPTQSVVLTSNSDVVEKDVVLN